MAKKKVAHPESAIGRINKGLDEAIKTGISKETAVLTLILIEIQVLENRIDALEGKPRQK